MRFESWASLLACNLANPCLGREPKARVATISKRPLINKWDKHVNVDLRELRKNSKSTSS
jgi:hypothetical protein